MNDSYPTLSHQPIEVAKIATEPPQRIGRYRVERIRGSTAPPLYMLPPPIVLPVPALETGAVMPLP